MQEAGQQDYPHLTPEEVTELADSKTNVLMLAVIFKRIITHINIQIQASNHTR
jgi:hypothetical protein